MCRIEDIEIEMHREMREPLGRDPVEDRPAAVSNGGGRDMPDAQILQDRVFIRAPPLHAGDHHLPGVQLAGHFGRESLVAPAKQQAKDMGMDVRKRSEEHTSELQSLMRNSNPCVCLKNNKISPKRT